jgi:PhnB protein
MQLNPYLLFNGNCREAFDFYQRTLGAKIESLLTPEGTPAEAHTPPEARQSVLHGRILINGQSVMASDCPPDRYAAPQGFSIHLGYRTPEESERIFRALADGGEVRMPIQETFWAQRFGMLVDRFGIPWMVDCEKSRVEIEKMMECQTAAR